MASNPYVNKVQLADGTALIDISDTTATADKIMQGYTAYGANGQLLTGTATGGASNIASGTFKGSSSGAMDVSVSYTGSGYPVAIIIAPAGGIRGSDYYSTIQRYTVGHWSAYKTFESVAATYSGTGQQSYYTVASVYKNSSSSATSTTRTSNVNETVSDGTTPTASDAIKVVKLKSKNTMSVYIASSSYGFMPNIDYQYHIIYSS